MDIHGEEVAKFRGAVNILALIGVISIISAVSYGLTELILLICDRQEVKPR